MPPRGAPPAGPNDVAAALEAAGFEMPLPTLARQWREDAEGLAEVREAVRGLVRGEAGEEA